LKKTREKKRGRGAHASHFSIVTGEGKKKKKGSHWQLGGGKRPKDILLLPGQVVGGKKGGWIGAKL